MSKLWRGRVDSHFGLVFWRWGIGFLSGIMECLHSLSGSLVFRAALVSRLKLTLGLHIGAGRDIGRTSISLIIILAKAPSNSSTITTVCPRRMMSYGLRWLSYLLSDARIQSGSQAECRRDLGSPIVAPVDSGRLYLLAGVCTSESLQSTLEQPIVALL